MKNYKMNLKVVCMSVLMGLIISPSLIAQKPNYKFKSISQRDGLISSTVQTIFEDSFGLIWLGTQHGVQQYDGITYRNFEHTESDSTGLSHNGINGYCEDADRNIWIATAEGLNIYTRKTDKITRYKWHNRYLNEYGRTSISRIIRDGSDSNFLWMTVRGIGLVRLNTRNDSAAYYSSGSENDKFFTWILPNPLDKNELLLGGSSLFSFDKISGKFREIFGLEENSQIPNNLVNDAVIDPESNNIIWLATGDFWGRGDLGGLIKYDLATGSKRVYSPENRRDDMPDRHLMCLCFYGDNELWIGTRINGALLYKKDEDRFYNFQNNEYDEGSLVTKNSVRSFLVDRSGSLWFGTWGDGISILSPAAQKFAHYKRLPQDKNGLPDNYINTFTEDENGYIWIGTKSGGLSRFDPRTKTFKNFFQEFSSSGANPTEINYLFYDSHKNLWIGTYSDALYRYDPRSGAKVHYKKGASKNEVTQYRISAICELTPGEILISTYGGGLNIYNYETDSFRHYLHNPNDSNSIPDNQIWLPFLGDDGKYYFSGNSVAGLIQFDPVTEKFSEILTRSDLLSFMMPTKSSDGRIFINDVGTGLSELRFQDGIKISTVYDLNGNGILNVESILIDSENILWLGTGNGLVEYDPDMKTVTRFDASDGLQGYEFNRFAGFKSSAGAMYFGGKNGFSVFHPDEIKLSEYEPPVVLTDFKLFQESVPIGEGSPLKQNLLLMDEIELNHDQNDFTISFAALDFSNPNKIEYKYILENHDAGWINVGHSNSASYTNMDPGKYTLKVLATNADGIWNEKVKSLRIIIDPPWWLTGWAYGFYALLFAAGVFATDRFMRNRLIRRERDRSRAFKLEQAKKIEKAYHELQATQAQLIQSEKMASLGELTAGIAHEIQNPLNFVNNFSEVSAELVEEMKQELANGSWQSAAEIADDIKLNLEKILHHGKRADGIVKGMLQHSRASAGVKEPTDINVLADEYLRLSYHGLRAKNKSFNADFKTELDASLPKVSVIPQDIGRVLLNLINNAFYAVSAKASSIEDMNYKPTVLISTKKLDGQIEIRVKDNGSGIPHHVISKIFQPFFTTKPAGEGTGLGLSMSYDIITKGHGGELKVETKEGTGTEFIIRIPIYES